jgi:hypothetical protein
MYYYYYYHYYYYCGITQYEVFGGGCSTEGETRNVYKILVGKVEEKRALKKINGKYQDDVTIYSGEGVADLQQGLMAV